MFITAQSRQYNGCSREIMGSATYRMSYAPAKTVSNFQQSMIPKEQTIIHVLGKPLLFVKYLCSGDI
jgi:hypothetical protein